MHFDLFGVEYTDICDSPKGSELLQLKTNLHNC